MGLDVELVEGVGPVVAEPGAHARRRRAPARARSGGGVRAAPRGDPASCARELAADQAVVGFCGGPFTVAGYLVEGRPSREFADGEGADVRASPGCGGRCSTSSPTASARYAAAQVRAGADVVQLFDSWVGALSPADYEEFVAPWSARDPRRRRGVPTIHFGTGTSTLLEAMARAGGDVIGLDWRIPLDDGWALVGDERGVQGNLDPAVLLGPVGARRVGARGTSSRAPAGGPATSSTSATACCRRRIPRSLTRLVELVQEATVRGRHGTMRRSGADGVRLAGAPRGRSRLLRRHPRRPADLARATSRISSRATGGSGSRSPTR